VPRSTFRQSDSRSIARASARRTRGSARWGTFRIHPHIRGGEERLDPERRRVLRAVGVDLAQRHLPGDVQLAGAEHTLLRVGVVGRVEMDLVQLDRGAIPVLGTAGDDHLLVLPPLLQHERPVADMIFRPGPGCALARQPAEFLHHVQRHGIPARVQQQVEKVARRVVQRDPHRARIGRLETRGAEVGQPALVVGLRARHHVEIVRILGGEGRSEHALPGVDKVPRRDRAAVRPDRVGAQVKRVRQPVRRDFPALRHPRARVQRLRVRNDQPLDQRADDVRLRPAGDRLGIKVGGLRRIAHVEHLQ
jgi:hypothetical protein